MNPQTTTGGGGLIEVPDGTWPVVILARELARGGAHVTLELRLDGEGGVAAVALARREGPILVLEHAAARLAPPPPLTLLGP